MTTQGKYVEKNCLNCNKIFKALVKHINQGNGKFCCQSCSSQYNGKRLGRKTPKVELECCYCGIKFIRNKSIYKKRKKLNKTKYVFCSKECMNEAKKKNSHLKEFNPYAKYENNLNKILRSGYRKLAFEGKEHKCEDCGYDTHIEILEVHHIDFNRDNNILENLVIVCPTCHQVRHFLTKTGRYHNNKH